MAADAVLSENGTERRGRLIAIDGRKRTRGGTLGRFVGQRRGMSPHGFDTGGEQQTDRHTRSERPQYSLPHVTLRGGHERTGAAMIS